MNMGATIARLAQGRFTVTRPSGSYVAGRWVEGAAETFEIAASIQPATPKELQRLPEGDRVKAVIAIWTTTELRVGEGAQADRVSYGGGTYEVQAVERWDLGEYFKALASRVA
jgi:hypothetical protein